MSEDKSLLLKFQDMCLQDLINLVPLEKRAKAIQIAEEYKQTSKALASVTPGSNRDRYAGIQYVIDAIRLYLSDVGRPLVEQEIIEGVVACGFRPLRPKKTAGDIKKSLKMYLEGDGEKKHEIKKVNGLVGLYEWDEADFKK